MEMEILAATSPNLTNFRDTFNKFSGELAGICYMPKEIDSILSQPIEKKLSRAEVTKQNGHHSVFDHEYVTLYLQDVPKMFAMLLNNEKVYTTSEKSARYTKIQSSGIQLDLFLKWQEIIKDLIAKKYGNQPYFSEKSIEKLAQENARYFLSIYTPTSLTYTVSYRQLNYIYAWLKNLDKTNSELIYNLKPVADEFCSLLENNNLIDDDLVQYALGRQFSLIAPKEREEYFGDVYSTNYQGSFASLAQAQRHRSLNYEMKELNIKSYYIPKILESTDLQEMWIEDMLKVEDVTPQGQLVQIYERGTPENFILKVKERLCTCAQLEIANQKKYFAKIYYKHEWFRNQNHAWKIQSWSTLHKRIRL